MTVPATFLLAFSCAIGGALGGVRNFCMSALLCLAFCFFVPFLKPFPPKFAKGILLFGMLFSLFPLWPLLFAELGEGKAPVLFALCVGTVLLLTASRQPFLQNASLPISFLALLFCLLCLFSPQDSTTKEPVFAFGSALFAPFAAFCVLPNVCKEKTPSPLCIASCTAAAFVSALPVLLFDAPMCVALVSVVTEPICASAELRIFCGKDA